MVAGDHDRADAGAFCVMHRVLRLFPGRIHHGDQTQECIIFLILQGKHIVLSHFFTGKGQDTQSVSREPLVLLQDLFPVVFGKSSHPVRFRNLRHPAQKHIHRAFGEHRGYSMQTIFGAHQFTVRIKRDLFHPGHHAADRLLGNTRSGKPGFRGHLQQTVFCRISHSASVFLQIRIVSQNRRIQEISVKLSPDIHLFRADHLSVDVDLLHSHAVLCQSAGLIGADHRHASQALHGFQFFDDGVFFHHPLSTHSLDNRHYGTERFRNRGNRQRHCEHQRIQNRHIPVHAQEKYHNTDGNNDNCQFLAEIIQTHLKRRLFRLGIVHQVGDRTDLCIHAGARHQHIRAPVRDQTSGEDHVGAVCQRLLSFQHLVGLIHIGRLAGQRTFIDLQRIVLQDPAVRHNHIPCFQTEDIARHHQFRFDLHFAPVPENLCMRRRQCLQRVQRFLRLYILNRAQHRIEHDYYKNNDRAFYIAGDHGNNRRHNQDQHQQIGKLFQKYLERALLLRLFQRVSPDFIQLFLRLL